jgi:hypothetical protein
MGQITTVDIGRVAFETIQAAERGKAVSCRALRSRDPLAGWHGPARTVSYLIGRRWRLPGTQTEQTEDVKWNQAK